MTNYRETGLSTWGESCAACDRRIGLEVHHLNNDRSDGRPENLMPLCGTCHNLVTAGKLHVTPDRQIQITAAHRFDTGPYTPLPPIDVEVHLVDFQEQIPQTWELGGHRRLLLLRDGVSKAYYVECHVPAHVLAKSLDFDAVLDPEGGQDDEPDEPYRFNRSINESSQVFRDLVTDARGGRPFADIIVEWNTAYSPSKPLKVLGGQHRGAALQSAVEDGLEVDRLHGIRVYFQLTAEQRADLVSIANANIAIPNQLLDRIAEHQLGGRSRSWCQDVGLLLPGQDFTDRLSSENRMTVQVMRAFVTNYVKGMQFPGDTQQDLFSAISIPRTGHSEPDIEYQKAVESFPEIWTDADFMTAGREYARLHKIQVKASETAQGELRKVAFRYKAMQPTVAAGWAFVAGLLRMNDQQDRLSTLYHLPDHFDKRSSQDPLNAITMSNIKDTTESQTYRGLGARQSPGEAQKLAELFMLVANPDFQNHITNDLIRAAIAEYWRKKSNHDAKQALETARNVHNQVRGA